ncbi:MAG: L-glutamate gamma-semialdehyde dehydrogenase [Frankiaceae bacterium]
MDAITAPPEPRNEPVRSYAPHSAERASLEARLKEISAQRQPLTMCIGGRHRMGAGTPIDVVAPHRHSMFLGTMGQATPDDVTAAIEAAGRAAPGWRAMSFEDRAAVFLRAADLLVGPWRDTLNAATMLGQSKSCYQAEIDAACELIDFWRYNVAFARRILADQPLSAPTTWNRMDHRPLEGFVLAITPFNFTSIAGNLPTAPAIMGNTVVWKASPTQQLAAHYTMALLEAAGLPPGVVNLVTGEGRAVSEVALRHEDLAGIHFTGSTRVFQMLWRTVGERVSSYRGYPRLVGETGGKDFVLAHPSADPEAVLAGLVRGAFEYQGQKCSAASRTYLPRSLWEAGLGERLVAETQALTYGDVADFTNFGGAVIDRRAFDKLAGVLGMARSDPAVSVLAGGTADDSAGFFVEPTLLACSDPNHEIFKTEYFGPILSVFIYPDDRYAEAVEHVRVSRYALTGAIFARDRAAIAAATQALRFEAGNFYVNDKPTGAVVGQQPFGGSRASGTNDKAGSVLNLLRWSSPRSIKENFSPSVDIGYPHQR